MYGSVYPHRILSFIFWPEYTRDNHSCKITGFSNVVVVLTWRSILRLAANVGISDRKGLAKHLSSDSLITENKAKTNAEICWTFLEILITKVTPFDIVLMSLRYYGYEFCLLSPFAIVALIKCVLKGWHLLIRRFICLISCSGRCNWNNLAMHQGEQKDVKHKTILNILA